MRSILICGLCLALHIYANAQYIQKTTLELKGEPVDLVHLGDKSVHIVTSSSIYQFSNGQIFHKGDHPALLQHKASWTDQAEVFIYHGVHDSDFRIDENINHLPLASEFGSGTLLWKDDFILHTNQEISRLSKDSIVTLSSYKLENPQDWLYTIYKGKPCMAHESQGVMVFDSENNAIRNLDYTWFGTRPTALAGIGDSLFVGFNGGYTLISNTSARSVALNRLIGTSQVLKFLQNGHKTYILTPEKIVVNENNNHYTLDVKLTNDDELVDIIVGTNDELIVLTRKELWILGSNDNQGFQNLSNDDALISLYHIRDRTYYSEGSRVYKYNPYTRSWILNPNKVPPKKTITDDEGNTCLIFNSEARLLDKNDASLKARWTIPDENILNLEITNEGTFLCTDQNLYLDLADGWEKINTVTDSFLHVMLNPNGIFAISTKQVYQITDDGMVALEDVGPYRFLENGGFSSIEDHILIGAQNGIVDFNAQTLESRLIYKRANILDYYISGELMFILTPGSLMAYDRSAFLNETLEIKGIKYFDSTLSKGRIANFDDGRIWISSTSGIYHYDLEEFNNYKSNTLFLDRVETEQKGIIEIGNATQFHITKNDLPLRLYYQHKRYQEADDQYRFHIGHNKNKETQWSKSPEMVFNQVDAGTYFIQAEMIDGISNMRILAPAIQIEVFKPTQLSGTTVLIVTLGAIFLIFLLVRGINRN
ncbi:MAG: hypothetical protein HKN09_11185 [Saprospiraceae bacterium]|nr:hypothetical protein [Saprospiraceae bacterium]